MKKNTIMLLVCIAIFSACNTTSPEKYFSTTVLNTNMLAGFGDEMQFRQMESTSVMLDENGNSVTMKRTDELSQRIKLLNDAYSNIKDLQETAETRDLIQSSVNLYEYVLPVYKTEYQELAHLYDEFAPAEAIHSQQKLIHDKYYSGYQELVNKLISVGEMYASKKAIKVNWDVKSSPDL